MARDPLDEDGRRYGVDGIEDGECSRMGWDESFTQGLTVCTKEYGDRRIAGIGKFPGYCRFHGSCFLLIGAGRGWSFCFDGGDYIGLERGASSDNCSFTPVSCPSTSGPIGVDNVISLIWIDSGEATLAF